jgi:hypothetical protein
MIFKDKISIKYQRRENMRTSTRKHGIVAVAAALLVGAIMLVTTGCAGDTSTGITGSDFILPEGKGAIQFSFAPKVARSITVDVGTNIDFFTDFTFTFTPAVVGVGTLKTVAHEEKSYFDDNPIVLDPGTYNLTVIAYIDKNLTIHGGDGLGPVDYVEAAGTKAAIEVVAKAGHIDTQTVILNPLVDSTKTGTFEYTIDNSLIEDADITTATIAITPIGTGTTIVPKDIKALFEPDVPAAVNHTDSETLISGYYYVDFEIKPKSNAETVTFRYILHVYQNMTSSFTFTIGVSYFNAYFKSSSMTLEPGDLKPELDAEIDSVAAGSLADGGSITVIRGEVLTLTVTNGGTSDNDYQSYQWYCLDTTSLGATDVLELDTNDPPFDKDTSSARDYLVTVIGVTSDGKPHSSSIKVTVEP